MTKKPKGNPYFKFFLGSPKRVMGTAIAILAVVSIFNPTLPSRVLFQLQTAFGPVIEPVIGMIILIAILIYAFKRITR
jgi:small-conductance mechanosensitive channel